MNVPSSGEREADLVALLVASPPRRGPDWLVRAAKEQAGSRGALLICACLLLIGTMGLWFGRVGFGFAGALLLLLALMGAYGVPYNLLARRRAVWLLTNGKVQDATVLTVERKKMPDGNDGRPPPVWAIVTLRSNVAGREYQHVVRSHLPEFIEFAESHQASGQPVFVLCDPARPQRVLLPETLY